MKTCIAALICLLAFSTHASASATIIIINADDPGEGFNDPAPAAPVGGNTGTTLGQQRLIAFQHAADIWGAELDTNQTIRVLAAFNPLPPNVLGSAGAWFVFSDFAGAGLHPGSEFPATWYGSALADKRAGADLEPGEPDIIARFSSNFNFYLGLDNNHGAQNDLVVVLLHELGHGLNFQNFVDETLGTNLADQTDIYARHTFDSTTNLFWDQMTDAERLQSATRFGRVVWEGTNVEAGVPSVLSFGSPELRVLSPAAIAGPFQFGTAAFGSPISSTGVTGTVVPAQDEAIPSGSTTTDGCTALTNAAAIAGRIALVERGTCTFQTKAFNAQSAGAMAVIIYNNLANVNGAPPGMALDPLAGQVTITTVSVTRADGLSILAQPPSSVSARLATDLTIRAGADTLGRARLYMPFPVVPGSSGSHYDSAASRNLLMEPAINPDLTHSVQAPQDLTLELLRDVGWFPDADLEGLADDVDACPGSNLDPTVSIGGVDTGITNTLFDNGCTISDLIGNAADAAKNHGQFVSAVVHLTKSLQAQGIITDEEQKILHKAAVKSKKS